MSQSIQPDSASKKLFNLVVQSLENCEDENKALVNVVDSCQLAHEKAQAEMKSSREINFLQGQIINNQGITIEMQREVISNSATILKNTKQIGRLRIFGWTIMGFSVGVAVPSVILLAKSLK